ncbi:MAG: hypothetical protein BGO44_16565 [Legionella sp. 39-23]|nr:MAG: hypothetical protein BGO44_16565 [Legionella sp. 39-23]
MMCQRTLRRNIDNKKEAAIIAIQGVATFFIEEIKSDHCTCEKEYAKKKIPSIYPENLSIFFIVIGIKSDSFYYEKSRMLSTSLNGVLYRFETSVHKTG